MLEQSDVELDFIYHTIGTGTVLPGMLAAKLMTGHSVRFRLISIQAYDEGDWMNPSVIVRRTQLVLASLGADVPADDVIRAEIDVDQRFGASSRIAAVPSSLGTA